MSPLAFAANRSKASVAFHSVLAACALLIAFTVQVIAAPSSSAATGTTIGGSNVPAYSGPGSSNSLTTTIGSGATVSFHCFVAGQKVTGPYGTEDLWDALDGGGYIPDALVYTGSNSAVVPACPSNQFGPGEFPVAWTGGNGAQPYGGTSTATGGDGSVLADGTVVTIACETSGEPLTDSAGFTSDLWDQLSGGGYIPNVYLDTEVNGPTPGVRACGSGSAPPPATQSSAPAAPSPSAQSGGDGSNATGSQPPASNPAPAPTVNLSTDVCLDSFGPGSMSSHSIFGGTETDYDRAASLNVACQGFGAPVSYTLPMKCAVIAAIASHGETSFLPTARNVCDAFGAAEDIADHNWLNGSADLVCGWFADILSAGVGIAAAGAASETGPGAVEIGVTTYRALAFSLPLVCGAIFGGGAATFGYNLETHHEAAIAADIINDGRCLHMRKIFGLIFWSSAAC